MANFYSMLSRLKGEQKLQGDLNKSLLGINVAQESQDINEARSQYRTDVDEAEREMAKKANKRSAAGTVATIGSAMLKFTGVTGKIASTVIAGVASGLARDSVKPYADTISTKLPGGEFHEQARLDLSADITSTNNFIDDAKEGQGLLNWTNALSDAYTTYQIGGAIEDFRSARDVASKTKGTVDKIKKDNPLGIGGVNVMGQGVGQESLYEDLPSNFNPISYGETFDTILKDFSEEERSNIVNKFMPAVLQTESDGNFTAKSDTTSASGGFQFVEGSVEPAVNRLRRITGELPWFEEALEHKDASLLTEIQQSQLFLGDLLQKRDDGGLMQKVFSGDLKGSLEAYYKLHHTNPDEATKNRASQIFGSFYE